MYKSTDGGAHWNKLSNGFPGGNVGRIGMDISPANPDVLYATVEGHGTFASTDRGESWNKRSGHETSGNYYVEFVCHPTDVNTVYSMDTYAHVSTDGGKTFNNIPKRFKHVDNHCLWIDPENTNHMYIGTDGGLGIEVTMENGFVKVVSPIDDTPAANITSLVRSVIAI